MNDPHLFNSKIKSRILTTADTLFYREGIQRVGISRLADEAGVAKASLYNTFKNKSDIIESYLRARHERIRNEMCSYQLPDAPLQKIIFLFEKLQIKARAPGFRGCAFLLAVSEHPESAEIARIALTHKTFINHYFFSALGEEPEMQVLANQLSTLYNGALAEITLYGEKFDLSSTLKAAETLFTAFRAPPF